MRFEDFCRTNYQARQALISICAIIDSAKTIADDLRDGTAPTCSEDCVENLLDAAFRLAELEHNFDVSQIRARKVEIENADFTDPLSRKSLFDERTQLEALERIMLKKRRIDVSKTRRVAEKILRMQPIVDALMGK
jgi:hypothetical protein